MKGARLTGKIELPARLAALAVGILKHHLHDMSAALVRHGAPSGLAIARPKRRAEAALWRPQVSASQPISPTLSKPSNGRS